MRKVFLNWKQVQGHCLELARQIAKDQWVPDYVVGITRGGATPAVLISQYLGANCEMLKVSLRDGGNVESNCWMAEDAFEGKKLLIVDDINDSGATIEWIKQDWKSSCHPKSERWEEVWGQNIRFAVLVNNEASKADVSYSSISINKLEDPQWIVFPWEEWWK